MSTKDPAAFRMFGVLLAALLFLPQSTLGAPPDDYAICQQTGDIQSSISACTRIIEDRNSGADDRALMYLRRGYAYFRQNDAQLAITDLTRSIELRPQDIFAYANRAMAYERVRDRDRAVADVMKARELDADQFASFLKSSDEFRALVDITDRSPPTPRMEIKADDGRSPGQSVTVTVDPESTSEQVFAQLAAQPGLSGALGTRPPRDGSLLPGRYEFKLGTDRKIVEKELERAAETALAEVWSQRDPALPLTSAQELLTLASIVEKESSLPDDRARLARVFENRLSRHMRLQSNATVAFGLFGGKSRSDHSLSKQELQVATPYNTYLIDGLPPGPIGNPSRASLEVVAHSPKTDEIYFVPIGMGKLAFASTLEEHSRNVARWRSMERQRK